MKNMRRRRRIRIKIIMMWIRIKIIMRRRTRNKAIETQSVFNNITITDTTPYVSIISTIV